MKTRTRIVYAILDRLLPVSVLPICLLDYDPFWRLRYHVEMYKCFDGSLTCLWSNMVQNRRLA